MTDNERTAPETEANRGNVTEEEDGKGSTWPQFAAGFAANISSLVVGCILGWTSPSLPKLEADDSPIKTTPEENSWISSLTPLAAVFGPFAAGFLAEKFGKKKTVLVNAIPALASWISLAFGESVHIIYVARILAGFASGWTFTVVPMYCSEIAQDSVRGAIGSLIQLFLVFGLLFDYTVGPYVSYYQLSTAAAAFPIIFVMVFFWMPESPYHLLGKGDIKQAQKSLKWLRGKSEEGVADELRIMQVEVENSKSQSGSFSDLFATRGTIKALMITFGLMIVQQLSGINAVLFNAQTIFKQAGGSLEPEISTIITGLVMMVASTCTPLVVDRLGKRILLLVSALGMGFAQVVLGLCFYLDSIGTDTSSFSFLPVIAVVLYIIVYSIGFGPLPWAVMGEMFPANIKSLASTLSASFCWFLTFLVTRFFNDLVQMIGNHFTFGIFGIWCFIGFGFVYILLPETKGMSLSEIQDLINS